jgi:osmotically-inducible protein OsmY
MVKRLLAGLNPLLFAALVAVTGCGLFHKKTPPAAYDDPQLKAKVEGALKSEPLLKDSQITVQSQNGVVQLFGKIDSLAAKERAGLVAASVAGIVQVKNNLLVRSPPTPTTP